MPTWVETLGCPERVAGLRNRKKPQLLPRHMTAMEVERLILATPDLRHRAAFITAYGAGLRVSETVSVKIGDIKSDKKCLHIPSGKGGTERMAPLPDGVIHYLRSYYKNIWPQPATWLFYGASPDEPMRVAALHRAFKTARDKVDIDPCHCCFARYLTTDFPDCFTRSLPGFPTLFDLCRSDAPVLTVSEGGAVALSD